MATSKRRPSGDGTIKEVTKTVNGKTYTYWEGKLTVGYDSGTGKQQRKSFSGKTQREVLEKMTRAKAEIQEEGKLFEASNLTVSQWADKWYESIEAKGTCYNTLKTYKSKIETHIKPKLGNIKLSKITKAQVQLFVDDLSKKKKPKTVHNIHGVLSKMLETAVDLEMIKKNPASKIHLPEIVEGENAKEIIPFTDEQINEFLGIAKDRKLGNALKFTLFTGLRESEVAGLTWDCVDFKTNTITVKKQLQRRKGGFAVQNATKSKRQREIVVAQSVIDMLKEIRTEQRLNKLKAGDSWKGFPTTKEQETSFVFTTEYGEHISTSEMYCSLKRIVKSMGLPNMTVHDLRHTYAVLSLENGDSIKTLQSNLGHATAGFTLDRYGHVSEKMRKESADNMDRFIASVANA